MYYYSNAPLSERNGLYSSAHVLLRAYDSIDVRRTPGVVDARVREQLLQRLGELPLELQRRIVEFADALAGSQLKGTPGRELVRLAGILDPVAAAEMIAAIEEGCERVDPREW